MYIPSRPTAYASIEHRMKPLQAAESIRAPPVGISRGEEERMSPAPHVGSGFRGFFQDLPEHSSSQCRKGFRCPEKIRNPKDAGLSEL